MSLNYSNEKLRKKLSIYECIDKALFINESKVARAPNGIAYDNQINYNNRNSYKKQKIEKPKNHFNRSATNLPRKNSEYKNHKIEKQKISVMELELNKNVSTFKENRLKPFLKAELDENSQIHSKNDILYLNPTKKAKLKNTDLFPDNNSNHNKLSFSENFINENAKFIFNIKFLNKSSNELDNSVINLQNTQNANEIQHNFNTIDLKEIQQDSDIVNKEIPISDIKSEDVKLDNIREKPKIKTELNSVSTEKLNSLNILTNHSRNFCSNKIKEVKNSDKQFVNDVKPHFTKEEAIKVSIGIYNKGLEIQRKKEEKIKLQREQEKIIERSYPFQPDLNKSRKSYLFCNDRSVNLSNRIRFHSYSDLTWLKKRDNSIEKLRKQNDKKNLAECTFSPNICKSIMKDDEIFISISRSTSTDYIKKARNFRKIKISLNNDSNNKHCYCYKFPISPRKIILNKINAIQKNNIKKDVSYYRSLSPAKVVLRRKSLKIENFFEENTENGNLNLNKKFTNEEVTQAFNQLKRVFA